MDTCVRNLKVTQPTNRASHTPSGSPDLIAAFTARLLPRDPRTRQEEKYTCTGLVKTTMAKQQWVIVTGGNRGIGLDVCKKVITRTGRQVLLTSRDPQAGKEAVAEIEKETGKQGSCVAAQLDVSDPSSVKAFVSEVASAYEQQIYALINNAGVFPHGWTPDAFDTAMATNFTGPLDLALSLAPHVVPGGRILHVTSGLGQLTNLSPAYRAKVTEADSIESLRSIAFDPTDSNEASSPTYNLTKAMLNRVSQLSVGHPAFKHLAVNSVNPGWVRTRMGGPNAYRSIDQGSESIFSVLELPADSTGGFWFDGKPQDF